MKLYDDWRYTVDAGPDFIGTPQFISNSSIGQSAMALIGNDAASTDIALTIERLFGDALINDLPVNPFPWMQGLNAVSDIFHFDSVSAFNGYLFNHFNKPVIVVLPYDPTKLSGIDPHRLRIARYDTTTNKWIVLENNTVLNTVNHTVANTTTDLTYFAVVYPARTQNSVTKILGASASNKKIAKIDGKSASPEINTKVIIANQKKTCFLFVCW